MTTTTNHAPEDHYGNVMATKNEYYGFFGTVILNTECSREDAEHIWVETCCDLISYYGLTAEQARDFLDSRDGRHLADAMTCPGGVGISGDFPVWTAKTIRRFLKSAE